MQTDSTRTGETRRKYATRASTAKRRQEILEAARVLLSEEGYDQLSLRRVAAAAGIHLKTLQHYFPSKEDLIQSTLEYTSSIYTEASSGFAGSSNPEQGFERYIRFLIDDDKDRRSAGFFYQLWARAHVDAPTNERMQAMYMSYTATIEQLMTEFNPDLSKKKRRQRAIMIGALIEGMMLYIGYGKDRPDGVGDIEKEVLRWCKKLAVE